jgi:hypothetical protein
MFPHDQALTNPQNFYQIAVLSKNLAHPNIVPLLGVTTEPLELISDWMPGGDLPEYVARHPKANRLSLVGLLSITLHDALTLSPVVRCG